MKTNLVHALSEIKESSYSLFNVGISHSAPLMVELCVNKKPVQGNLTHEPSYLSNQNLKSRIILNILKEKIETELDCLLSQGVIEPVKFAKWAAPIVLVVKADGTVCICGDELYVFVGTID